MKISIIIYANDLKYLKQTINSILNNIHQSFLAEIIICNDTGIPHSDNTNKVLNTNFIGYAKACNAATRIATGSHYVFIKSKTKFSPDWANSILKTLRDNPESLVSPIVHTLDLNYWSTEASRWRRFGWRWDLNIYDKSNNSNESPTISTYCIACRSDWFNKLGGFDDNMQYGAGPDIEISLRCWLFGGKVLIDDNTYIAVGIDQDKPSIDNLSRIIEVWMPKYSHLFYENLQHTKHNTGKLDNLINLQHHQVKTIEWFINKLQPELGKIYELRNQSVNKSIAIVGIGRSIDFIDTNLINRYDIIIGIDYIPQIIQCDFVITESQQVISSLLESYKKEQFITPNAIINTLTNVSVPTNDIIDGNYQYEHDYITPTSLFQPFIRNDDLMLTAIHLSLFLRPKSITVFGHDTKLIDGKSHTTQINEYNNGDILPDSESTSNKFNKTINNLRILSKLAQSVNIPLLSVSHI